MSAVFLSGALKNFLSWDETERDLIDALSNWQAQFGYFQDLQGVFSFLITWSTALLLIATGLLGLGGLLILIGKKERLALLLLIAFLIPATVLYHPFWWADDASYEVQTAMFLKNIAILGCMIRLVFHKSASLSSSDTRDSFSALRF